MASATKHNRISEHAARAEEALSARKVFDAERHACKALMLARQDGDFERMTTIIPMLTEARVRRLREATKGAKVTLVDTPVGEDVQVRKGCYLVVPPQVGADARRLRLAAFERGVCAAVLCREPLTQIRLLPMVAIGPGSTIRTKVRPPRNMDKPDVAWFTAAMEAMGNFAIESLDADMAPVRRVDALLERLDAIPEHAGLHQALVLACVEAKAADDADRSARAAKKALQAQRQAPARAIADGAAADEDAEGGAQHSPGDPLGDE